MDLRLVSDSLDYYSLISKRFEKMRNFSSLYINPYLLKDLNHDFSYFHNNLTAKERVYMSKMDIEDEGVEKNCQKFFLSSEKFVKIPASTNTKNTVSESLMQPQLSHKALYTNVISRIDKNTSFISKVIIADALEFRLILKKMDDSENLGAYIYRVADVEKLSYEFVSGLFHIELESLDKKSSGISQFFFSFSHNSLMAFGADDICSLITSPFRVKLWMRVNM